MQAFGEIDAATLVEWLDAGEDLKLVDVRTPGEVARGIISGAEHVPLHLVPLRAGELPAETPVVFYCRSGVRSAQACAYLTAKGYTNVYNLAGGIERWVSQGQPVAEGALRAQG